MAQTEAEPAHRNTEKNFTDDDRDECSGGGRERECARADGKHREPVQDQGSGIVRESFAFEDDKNAMGQLQPFGDGERRHDIRRRYDCAEDEAYTPWEAERVVRGCGDQHRRKDHAADCQQADRAQVGLELAPAHRHAGRIDQRRQHQ